jgi:hypothetical protein
VPVGEIEGTRRTGNPTSTWSKKMPPWQEFWDDRVVEQGPVSDTSPCDASDSIPEHQECDANWMPASTNVSSSMRLRVSLSTDE